MFKIIFTNLKHFFITATLLLLIITAVGVYFFSADIHYGDNPLAYKIGNEGPHVFFEQGQLSVNYIRGGREDGFYAEQQHYPVDQPFQASVYFPLEDSEFNLEVNPVITPPEVIYQDNNPVVAISDIEGGFKTFRDFLIANAVIDQQLNWTFEQGHLVLVGDFVDRGFSTTQVLWFIYKLEQEALKQGGKVHFVLGNHEIKNLQGNYQKAARKYFHIASIMGKKEYQLYDQNAFLGRWMLSKNSLELINGNLFVHGGIHPQLAELNYSLQQINQIVRDHYTQAYFPQPDSDDKDIFISTRTGPSWYRGYFEEDLSQQDVEKGLDKFNASAVIVGHTPQWAVNKQYNGKVFAIDVKHPKDYRGSFPPRHSEGLLIDNGQYFRLLDNGEQIAL